MTMHLRKNKIFSQKIYWVNKLSGELSETNLILDYIRPSLSSSKKKSLSFELSHDLSHKILKLAKGSYFSTYLILVSALNILLQKYTRSNDIIVGIPIYEKNGTNDLNSKVIPLRTQVIPQLSFKDFLLQVQDSVIGAYSHQNYNFDDLIQLLKISTSPNRCPICDIVVLLENIHNVKNLNNLNNDITFWFSINGETIGANIKYSEDMFKYENIKIISRYYINIIENIINNIDTKISDIYILKDFDRHLLLKQFNENSKEYPITQSINYLFEEQVDKTPNNIAVVHEKSKLTYQELNEKANQLAVMLRKLGVNKGEFVGIFKDRDINFIISILAIYKAGGAYVPIDSTYPLNRIEYMLSNSEVRFLLTDFLLLNTLGDLVDNCYQLKTIICLDEFVSENIQLTQEKEFKIYNKFDFNNFPKENLEQVNDGIDPAYMIYTSGSTGLPKGTIVRHDGAINHIYAQFDQLEITEDFCFLQSAPSSTDISVWQFLAPLLIGGKTVIVDIETVAIPDQLFKVLFSAEITVVELVPTLFAGLLEYISQLPKHERVLPNLKWMMLSGESVSPLLVNKWLEIYPQIRIANAYGPSEAADDITQFIVDKLFDQNQRTIPIGKPLANLNLYILDSQMKLLPIGVPGEICVSGIGVGAGYWKNEEKTKNSFVPNPFTDARKNLPGNRQDLIYKTGDLGRWLTDGNIEFLGRIDHQVKIRGFRVELGEIETILSQHQAVKEVVVVVREDNPDNQRLIAYVVPRAEFDRDDSTSNELVQQLRDFLTEKLPGHMIPSAIVLLEALPLAPSGKIDHRALPVPNFNNKSEFGFVAPRTSTEEIVADIWSQVLKQEHIGIHDNFFDLGGHSLLATQVISRLREAFKVELPLRSLFEAPTVAQLVESIEKDKNVTLSPQKQFIQPAPPQENLFLSFAQQRLWFIEQFEKSDSLYNLPFALHLKGLLNLTALKRTLNEIVQRHEVLRANFKSRKGQPFQIIRPTLILSLPIINLENLKQVDRENELQRLVNEEGSGCFNLSEDPLLRCRIFKLDEEEYVLTLIMHHIISDGWSMRVIVDEVTALYKAFCQNQASPLLELPIQYSDFAFWQQQLLRQGKLDTQIQYWKQQLAGAKTVIKLPTDKPRTQLQSSRGAIYSFALSSNLSHSLKILSQKQDVTMFMTLVTAYNVLLYYYTNQEDILVGTPISNRNQSETESLIGLFVNTLVLRTNLSNNPSFQQLLQQTREVALGAYANQDLPFEKLVTELQPERRPNQSPLFQVWFVIHNVPISKLDLPGLKINVLEAESLMEQRNVRHDLNLDISETSDGIKGFFEYKIDLFNTTTIAQMAKLFEIVLEIVVKQPDIQLKELIELLNESQKQQQILANQEFQKVRRQKLGKLFRKAPTHIN
ncbi:MAG: amino acid adenylation domain-containing protein [Nostocales cyanobacterium 94392]|nr:amino acid adenylation domain-containing protein [Nostocales cyanobacterium 94392]